MLRAHQGGQETVVEGTTHQDGHGSVTALTDATETVTDRYTHDAWGTLLAATGTTPNPYRYTGEAFDSHLGFYYLRARFYNPSHGRFSTFDSWPGEPEEPLGLHKYLYGNANPVNRRDPSGQFSLLELQAVNAIRFELITYYGDVYNYYVGVRVPPHLGLTQEDYETILSSLEDGIFLSPRFTNKPILAGKLRFVKKLPRFSPGRRGGPDHRGRIEQVETFLTAKGWKRLKGGSVSEEAVKITSTGIRRFPDLTMVQGNRTIAIQVGRLGRDGLPVKREWKPLLDLSEEFDKVLFVPFF